MQRYSWMIAASLFLAVPVAAENLALGRTWTWSVPPNYAACSDAGDARQLSDGERIHSTMGWTRPAMVGWSLGQGARVALRLELDAEARIDQVLISTRLFRRAEVAPPSVVIATSRNGIDYEWAGSHDASDFDPSPRRDSRKVDLALQLRRGTVARHVLVLGLLNDAFLFIDEIEIHGSTTARLPGSNERAPRAPGTRFQLDEVDRVAADHRRLSSLRRALPGRLAERRRFPAVSVREEESARLAARAPAWRRRLPRTVGATRADPWQPRDPWSAPRAAADDTLRMVLGGTEVLAFDAWCAADSPAVVDARLRRMPSGNLRVTFREVVHVEARDGRWPADALLRLDEPLRLRPGESRQVWLDIDARRARTGVHRFSVDIAGDPFDVVVRVDSCALSEPPLEICTFTYPTLWPLLVDHPQRAITDNIDAGVQSGYLSPRTVPWPEVNSIDATGSLGRIDWTVGDNALRLYRSTGPVRRIGWYWNFWMESTDPSGGRFRHAYQSDPWRHAVGEWLRGWLAHLEAGGLRRRDIFMQPVDERAGERVADIYRFVKQLQPELTLALSVTGAQSRAEAAAVEPWIDIAIVHRPSLDAHAQLVERLQARGKEVWVYDVPRPSKSSSPEASYRMLLWEAWGRALQGCAFWSYGHATDDDGNAWNDFDGPEPDYAVVYGAKGAPREFGEPLAPSKRWRAFRLGTQDVRIFETAQHAIPGLRQKVLHAIHEPHERAQVLELARRAACRRRPQ